MGIKVVFNNKKTGKSVQKELSDDQSQALYSKKIGEEINGEVLDLTGYKLKITGGSDYTGIPMRRDIEGAQRKKILTVSGVGVKKFAKIKKVGERNVRHKFSGIQQRKLIAGNTIHAKTAQVNLVVLEMGKEDIFPKNEEKKQEQPKAKAE